LETDRFGDPARLCSSAPLIAGLWATSSADRRCVRRDDRRIDAAEGTNCAG
jgi:hypothetical protein